MEVQKIQLSESQVNKMQIEFRYRQLSEDYYQIVTIADKDQDHNKYGMVQLIKKKGGNQVYALKKISNIPEDQLVRLIKSKQHGCEVDDSNETGTTNNVIREFKFIQMMAETNKSHQNIIKFFNYEVSYEKREIGLVLEYFGGTSFKSTSIYKFFNKEHHIDIGYADRTVSKVVFNIFSQILDAVEFFHSFNECLRDLRDENILVRRREKEQFEIALADFGLNGKLNSKMTICKYPDYAFRDPLIAGQNYVQGCSVYTAKQDIYSLGIILRRLYCLYYLAFVRAGKIKLDCVTPVSYLREDNYYMKAVMSEIVSQ